MTRISEHFALGVSQPQLDFVDVDLATDTEVYVDPHAIRGLRTQWGAECAALLRLYFDAILGGPPRLDERACVLAREVGHECGDGVNRHHTIPGHRRAENSG